MVKESIYVAVVLLVAPIYAQAQDCSDLNMLSPLIGSWQEKTAEGVTAEQWKKVSPSTFEGVGMSFDKSLKETSRETLRIVEMSGEIFYLAKVRHNQFPIAFRLTECADNRFKFENAQHDFPQSITYEFDGDNRLRAVVRGGDGSGFEINFERTKND